MAACKRCGASISWCETEATAKKPGRPMPLDAGPDGEPLKVEGGNLVFTGHKTGALVPIIRYVPAGRGNRRSHFQTCPNADEFRRRNK